MTRYRVSGQVRDMHRLVSLARTMRQKAGRLIWPLVLAEDGPDLIAGCGTRIEHGLTCCAPLVLRGDLGRRAAVIAYRIGQLYDEAMYGIGIQAYYAYVAPTLPQYMYVLERLGFVKVPVEDEPGQWYRREPGPWGQVIDSSHAEAVDGFRQRLAAAGRV